MSLINPVTPPTPLTALNPMAAEPNESRRQELRADQIVQASVVEGGMERVLLELAGHRLRAETRLPLQAGQKLTLQVVRTSPQVELRVVENLLLERLGHAIHLLGEPRSLAALLDILPRPAGGGPEARTLVETLLQGLDPQGGKFFEGTPLKELARHLGLGLERALAAGDSQGATSGLKGALLALLPSLADGSPEALEGVRSWLQALELHQMCSLRLAEQGGWLLPLPLPFLEQGYLISERRRSGPDGEEEGPFRLTLHLCLEGLGDLRVDLLSEAEGLYLRLACQSEEKASFVQSFREELAESVTALPLQGLAVSAGAEAPDRALLRRVLPEGNGVLDARV